jgi:DNA-binding transcriptional regulator YbjK
MIPTIYTQSPADEKATVDRLIKTRYVASLDEMIDDAHEQISIGGKDSRQLQKWIDRLEEQQDNTKVIAQLKRLLNNNKETP